MMNVIKPHQRNETPWSMPTIGPALSITVHLSLTVTLTVLYAFIFLCAYIQLWLMRIHGYKKLSYQSVLLFVCLVFGALRLVLFSFYYNDNPTWGWLPFPLYWILICSPIILQYTSFVLILSFYVQVLSKARCHGFFTTYRFRIQVCLFASIVIFILINFTVGLLVFGIQFAPRDGYWLVVIRVALTDVMFVALASVLSFSIYLIANTNSTRLGLEARGITRGKAIVTAIGTIFLFMSRAVYNLLALFAQIPGFGFNWIDVTDQADFKSLQDGHSYLIYGFILIIWEILPTLCILYLFQIKLPRCRKKPDQIVSSSVTVDGVMSPSVVERSYFFSNIRRYDSHENSLPGGGPFPSSSYRTRNGYFAHYGSSEMRTAAGGSHIGPSPLTAAPNPLAPLMDSERQGGSLPLDKPARKTFPYSSLRDTLHLILPSPREDHLATVGTSASSSVPPPATPNIQ